MNKIAFLNKLEKTLKDNHIADIEDIVSEYEEHFRFKLADGFSEEEIAAKLGNPETLAKQFDSDISGSKSTGNKVIIGVGLSFADIFMFMLFILLFSWVFVMAAISITSASLGVCFIGNIQVYNIIPPMPYGCAIIFTIFTISLAILTALGTLYCFLYVKQLIRAYLRFHKNTMSAASGGCIYPKLALHPHITDKYRRLIRNIALSSLTVVASSFILGYIVCALSAGALEFWHEWNWFV